MKRILPLLLCLLLSLLFVGALAGCTPEELVGDAKPVVYLYPEEETEVTVRLDYQGETAEFSPFISLKDGSVDAGARGLLLTGEEDGG